MHEHSAVMRHIGPPAPSADPLHAPVRRGRVAAVVEDQGVAAVDALETGAYDALKEA